MCSCVLRDFPGTWRPSFLGAWLLGECSDCVVSWNPPDSPVRMEHCSRFITGYAEVWRACPRCKKLQSRTATMFTESECLHESGLSREQEPEEGMCVSLHLRLPPSTYLYLYVSNYLYTCLSREIETDLKDWLAQLWGLTSLICRVSWHVGDLGKSRSYGSHQGHSEGRIPFS